MSIVYDNIKKIRTLRNFTQEYVATQLKVSREWYGKLENGQSDISLSQIQKLSEVFQIEPQEFFGGDKGLNYFNYYKNGTYIQSQLKDEKAYELYERMLKSKDLEIEFLKNGKP